MANAMLNVTIRVEGDIVVDRIMRGIEERAHDLRPAWPAVVRAFQLSVQGAFASEGSATGAPWPDLAPSTQRDRARHGFPPAHPILKRTGQLERALTLGDGAYVSMQPTSLRYQLAEDVGYFVYHQSTRPRSKLPRRAPVELTATDRFTMVQPIRLYVTGHDAALAAYQQVPG